MFENLFFFFFFVCVCVCVCVRAYVRVCVCVCLCYLDGPSLEERLAAVDLGMCSTCTSKVQLKNSLLKSVLTLFNMLLSQ